MRRFIIVVCLFVASVTVLAGNYTIERIYTDPYDVYDDIYILLKVDTTLTDSIHCDSVSATNPCTCSVSLDEDTTYFMEVRGYETGTGWLDPSLAIFPRRNDGTMAATYNLRRIYTDPYGIYDSMCFVLKDGSTTRDSTFCDSVSPTHPCTCLVNMVDDSTYFAEVRAYETGTGWLDPSTVVYGRWGYPTTTVSGSLSGKTCIVSVVVRKSNGDPAENARVTMMPATVSRVIDSAGYAIIPIIQREKTDSLGVAQFTCMWSSYMIPETKWNIQVLGYGVGSLRRQITVPRDTVYTVDLR